MDRKMETKLFDMHDMRHTVDRFPDHPWRTEHSRGIIRNLQPLLIELRVYVFDQTILRVCCLDRRSNITHNTFIGSSLIAPVVLPILSKTRG